MVKSGSIDHLLDVSYGKEVEKAFGVTLQGVFLGSLVSIGSIDFCLDNQQQVAGTKRTQVSSYAQSDSFVTSWPASTSVSVVLRQ